MTGKKKQKKTWREMSGGQRAGVLVTGAVQLALAVTAWRDLARRPAEKVNGPKGAWAAVIAINYIGPVLYFVKGRKE